MSFLYSYKGATDNTQTTLGDRIAPGNLLRAYIKSAACCSLHVTVEERCKGGDDALVGPCGAHPAINAAARGFTKKCYAAGRVLARDKELAQAALSFSEIGFAYTKPEGLQRARRWENGAILGMGAFGRGYCYLHLIRPGARMRVARILGPCPMVQDVWLLYRLVGVYEASVCFRGVAPGLTHVEYGGAMRSGLELSSEMLGLAFMGDAMRLGASLEDAVLDLETVASGVATRYYSPIGKKGKAVCSQCRKVVTPQEHSDCVVRERSFCECCKCMVVTEGHAGRCILPKVKNPALELVGDAMHALDVKVVAITYCDKSQYSQIAGELMSAKAQKRYLQQVGVDLGKKASDHSWGSEFERRYCGAFRGDYLKLLGVGLVGSGCENRMPPDVKIVLQNYGLETLVGKTIGKKEREKGNSARGPSLGAIGRESKKGLAWIQKLVSVD